MQRKHCNLPVAELVRVPAAPEVPRLLLLGLAALLLVPTASTAGVTDAVVRVYAGDGAGCGTLIYAHDGRGLVLTAAHVVQRGGSPQTQWADGETSAATVVAASRPLDIALLAVSAPTSATTIPLAGSDQWPPQGETVELIGYGGGNLRHWQAKVNGYVMTEGTGKYQTLSLNTRTIGGDSGGAIVYRGRLVGVIWGGPLAGPRSPMLATHGTCCVAINTFLQTNNADPVQIAQRFPPACNGPICPLPPRIVPRQNPPVVVPLRVEPARVELPRVRALRYQIAK